MVFAELLMWISILGIFYTYLGYPLLLFLLLRYASFGGRERGNLSDMEFSGEDGSLWPMVSIVVAAHNEASRIGRRLENLCSQDYPKDRLEIVVVSDGSEDATETIVREFQRSENGMAGISVLYLGFPDRKGKPAALNAAVHTASGDILVFADCRQRFAPDTVRRLVARLKDQTIGCVSGRLVFLESPDSEIQAEMGAYWRYETLVRTLESATGSLVGVTGAVYALRRDLYRSIPPETLLDDLFVPINCQLQGQRVVLEEKAVAWDTVSKEVRGEWQRKVRTLAGNWQLFELVPDLRYPFGSQLRRRFWSHKVARLLVPFFLVTLFLGTTFSESQLASPLLMGQIIFYGLAGAGYVFPQARQWRIIGLCSFFMVLNCAALTGWYRWLRRDLTGCWTR